MDSVFGFIHISAELVWIILRPAIVGAIASQIVHGREGSFWESFFIGVFGALLGEWLMPKLGLSIAPLVDAIIGAVILLSL